MRKLKHGTTRGATSAGATFGPIRGPDDYRARHSGTVGGSQASAKPAAHPSVLASLVRRAAGDAVSPPGVIESA